LKVELKFVKLMMINDRKEEKMPKMRAHQRVIVETGLNLRKSQWTWTVNREVKLLRLLSEKEIIFGMKKQFSNWGISSGGIIRWFIRKKWRNFVYFQFWIEKINQKLLFEVKNEQKHKFKILKCSKTVKIIKKTNFSKSVIWNNSKLSET
jgi:hypothetical protein